MFRTGGTPNEGIMHGLVNRQGYDTGGSAEKYADEYYSMLSKYKPPAPRFPMGQVGLNLVSGEFAGDGFLSNVARSVKGPYSEWTQADDATRNLDYQARMSAAKMGISKDEAERLAMIKAKAKAAGQSPYLKDTSPQRSYEDFLKVNLEAKAKLERWQKPPLNAKYPRGVAEFDSKITRNLAATTNPQGKEIAANFADFVPFEIDEQEFDYSAMIPGMYYYDPRRRMFVQRVPDDPDTPENEGGYFQYHRDTFAKSKIQGTQ